MKKAIPFVAAWAFACALVLPLLAQTENPEPAPAEQQIEFDSKFISISVGAARRLGLIHLPDEPAKWRGVLAAPEYKDFLQLVTAEKGVDVYSVAPVIAKAGRRGVIESLEVFHNPSKYELRDPPPQGEEAMPALKAIAFDARNMGVTLVVEGTILPDHRISVVATPSLTESHGFVTYAGGKTQQTNVFLANSFSQLVFDFTRIDSSVTLRPGAAVLMGGFAGGFAKKGAQAEPELLFVTLTAREITVPDRPPEKPADLKMLKVGSPVKIETKLWNTTEDRLLPSLRAASDVQKYKVFPGRGPARAGVYNSAAIAEMFKSMEASDAQFSIGPKQVIASGGQYYVEAAGPLIYPGVSVSGSAGVNPKKPVEEGEILDFQLEVEPRVEEGSTIELNLLPALRLSDPPPAVRQNLGTRALGASALVWTTPELSPTKSPWRSPPGWLTQPGKTSAIPLSDGETVLLVNRAQGPSGHVQLLLITATGVESTITPEDSKPRGN